MRLAEPGAVTGAAGLTDTEAALRLDREGYNELPARTRNGLMGLAMEVASEPMFLLLLACGAIYMVLGDRQEALMLLGFVFFIMGISLYQARKTERSLEALREIASPRALVIRDGVQRRIPGREVVRGDLLVLAEGDRVPADGCVLTETALSVDESILTGESGSVGKSVRPGRMEMERPGGEGRPCVYSGTLVVRGTGLARVLATGADTELGRIGAALRDVAPAPSALQQETGRLVRTVAAGGLLLCGLAVAVFGLTRGNWLDGLLAGLALAMAVLPNELPVVLTVFLALGAWRMAQSRVLTRRMPALEALGSATVLCVDKTGTLTENRMALQRVMDEDGRAWEVGAALLDASPRRIVDAAALACVTEAVDPMDRALLERADGRREGLRLLRQYPLSRALLAVTQVWERPDGARRVAVKGAPEDVSRLCRLTGKTRERTLEDASAMAAEGLRVLAVAEALMPAEELPEDPLGFALEYRGLVGLSDPVRATVGAALGECYAAGLRVVMITGDHPATAVQVARQIGLQPLDPVITGAELDAMDDERLRRCVRVASVYARVLPEHKLRLVTALQAGGEVVAMTGDGVNDAAALKAAQIGIAMGRHGTDVARESAALVLLDDDFASIERAVRMGRRVLDNLRKAMAYLLGIHVPIVGLSLIPILLRWPLILMPVHIAFLHLIIDPACSVVFEAEPEDEDVMRRPPRDPHAPLLGRSVLRAGVLQGVAVLAAALGVLALARVRGLDPAAARAAAFTTLILGNLGLVFVNRSWQATVAATVRRRNRALWWVTAGALALLATVLYVPWLRVMFRFARLTPLDLLSCAGAAAAALAGFEAAKTWRRPRRRTAGSRAMPPGPGLERARR